jgi:predicted DCC family thiol-disulfide oxidoreductase YuxK
MAEARPTLIYDGDCGICRTWVDYWARLTGDCVAYRPYQEAARDFPSIPVTDFARAIQLVEEDGRVYAGAAASFRVLAYAPGHGGWWWLYRHVPGFAASSERAYAFFAVRRALLARLTRLLWGARLEPASYRLASALFLRLLGAIYVAAFASLGVQITGLVGENGILPLGHYLEAAREGWGVAAYWSLPTLFWIDASDLALVGGSVSGVALGCLVAAGYGLRPALVALYLLYVSFIYAGQTFTSYQWDLLLAESGFVAIFLSSGSVIVLWLYRWLLFRYMFLSGAVKVLSNFPTWQNLTALDYHLWTQPLPTPLAWYAAQLPHAVLAAATAVTLLLELALVFLIFLPRRPRAVAAWSVVAFQILIMLTGNFAFFNLLTISLCVLLLDDAALRPLLPGRLASWTALDLPYGGRAATAAAVALVVVTVPPGIDRIWTAFSGAGLPLAGAITRAVSPLLIVNDYGPFATTTRTRPEIVIEGSDDGEAWRPYVFRYKPGPVERAPRWNVPHQPRLDWQMWFAAYGTFSDNPWFGALMQRLLEGRPEVLELLAVSPFPERPPKYVRALLYEYRFARGETDAGSWWARRLTGIYFPQTSLEDLERLQQGPAT